MVLNKNIFFTVLFFLNIAFVSAQNETSFVPRSEEILEQKKTQIKYLTKFIATMGLKLFIMNKGKKLQDAKLGGVADNKSANFQDDASHIENLSVVSLSVMELNAVEKIMGYSHSINDYLEQTTKTLNANFDFVSPSKLVVFEDMISGLRSKINADMSEIEMLILSSNLKFSDDERLQKLEFIASDYDDKKRFAQMIYQRAITQIESVKQELRNIKQSELLLTNN